jgi:hypothetical protein
MQSVRLAISFSMLTAAGLAQSSGTNGPAPRTQDGKPDLSGIWQSDGRFSGDFSKALKPGEKILMLSSAETVFKTRRPKDDPASRCLPMGVPRLSTYPEKLVQLPNELAILFEGDIHSYRQIFFAASHNKDVNPTWYGDSVGRWEGDTLVVDTIGFNDRTWLDSIGHPHTEKLHVIERYRRPNFATLELEVTVEDPGAYSKPFTMTGRFSLSDKEIRERSCYKSPVDK